MDIQTMKEEIDHIDTSIRKEVERILTLSKYGSKTGKLRKPGETWSGILIRRLDSLYCPDCGGSINTKTLRTGLSTIGWANCNCGWEWAGHIYKRQIINYMEQGGRLVL